MTQVDTQVDLPVPGYPRGTAPGIGTRARWQVGSAMVSLVAAAQQASGDPIGAALGSQAVQDPYGFAEKIRQRGDLVSGALGHLTVSHAVAGVVLRDHRRFGSTRVQPPAPPLAHRLLDHLLRDTAAMGQGGGEHGAPRRARLLPPEPLGYESMIGMNPPDHARLRRLVSGAFTPKAVDRLRPRVEAVADDLLDRMERQDGPVDLIGQFAAPLPIAMIADMFGIPERHSAVMHQWGDALAINLELPTPAQQLALDRARVEFGAYLEQLLAQRRRQPGDRVIDDLLAAGGAGAGDDPPLNARELVAMSTLLLIAGFETTVNLIGNAVSALLLHPEQRRRVTAEPSLIPNAVEEVLRWDPPLQIDNRYVRESTVLAGRDLAPGDRVVIMLSGVNRDPEVFADPHTFDVTRGDATRHLSFGAGVHHCLGASLARLEGQVALGRLLERFPRFVAAGPGRRRRGRTLRGLEHLPVVLDPGRHVGTGATTAS